MIIQYLCFKVCVSSNLIENKISMILTVEQQVYMYLWLSSLLLVIRLKLGLPGGSVVVKKKSRLPMQETWVWSLGWENPLEEEVATHSSILVWEIRGERSLKGYCPWGCKRVRHNWVTNTFISYNLLLFWLIWNMFVMFIKNWDHITELFILIRFI